MSRNSDAVYIIDGCRTPFLKARTEPGAFSGSDLAVYAARELLNRQSFSLSAIDEVIVGCNIPSPKEANIARVIGLRLGCNERTPAYTVQRNCASGLQSLDNAYQDIKFGRHDLILAGGTDAMSHAPLLYPQEMAAWLGQWFSAKTVPQKLKILTKIRPRFFAPIISLLIGLTDPVVGLSMGQTAEEVAYCFHITRAQMDEFALLSHTRVIEAVKAGYYDEITPIYDRNGNCYAVDDGVRADSSLEKLAQLKPYFDKPYGDVTAGNSSQVTDGAAMLILASAAAVDQYHLKPIAKIIDSEWIGVDPAKMGLGPAYAIPALLKRYKLALNDIDYFEINEAFAAQVLACLAAWQDPEFCKSALDLAKPFGALGFDRLNIDGGAIALGHPVGASGARLVLHLAHILKRKGAKRGVASLCIGGGQGGAMLIENVE